MSIATIEHSEESDELIRLRRLVRALQGALGTEEDGAALVEVARNAHTTELQIAYGAVIDDFCDAVLAKLKAFGVPETENCDGDEDVSTIFAGWIYSRISDALEQLTDARGETCAWAAMALNCKQALAGLLKFHPESPETGAELPPECWTPEYRDAVMRAAKCLNEANKP